MCNLRKIIENLDSQRDLQEQQQRILDILEDHGQHAIHEDPQIFLLFVEKAWFLLSSPVYLEVLRKMVEIYQTVSNKPDEGPLDIFVSQITFMSNLETMSAEKHQEISTEIKNKIRGFYRGAFADYQCNMLSVAKTLMDVDDSCDSRTECYGALMLNAKYVSMKGKFQWSDQFINILNLLLEQEADPRSTPEDILPPSTHFEEKCKQSLMYSLFKGAAVILANEIQVANMVIELLMLHLTEECLNNKEPKGTLLHALVNCDWDGLPVVLPGDFIKYYERIVSIFADSNPTLLDLPDLDGRNPLQCFVNGITKSKHMLPIASAIIPVLKSKTSMDATDKKGQTALHILQERAPQINPETFLELTGYLRTSSNIDIQDKYKQTPLHILASHASEVRPDALLELNGCLKSSANIDKQDTNGHTVLHILAENVSHIGIVAFHQLVHCLRSSSNTAILDYNGRTILDLLHDHYPQESGELADVIPLLTGNHDRSANDLCSTTPAPNISDQDAEMFFDIEKIFLSKGGNHDMAMTGVKAIAPGDSKKGNPSKSRQQEKDCDEICSTLNHTIENLEELNNLDENTEKKILQLLSDNENWILQKNCDVFFCMIEKANYLMESRRYYNIIKKMAALYKTVTNKPRQGPLSYFVREIKDFPDETCADQRKLFTLIKTFMSVDDSTESRTRCLRKLLKNAKYISRDHRIAWTVELIDVLKLLLQEGADPTWIPKHNSDSSVYRVIKRMFLILSKHPELVNELKGFALLLLSEKFLRHEEPKGTVLHALVNCDWSELPDDLPDDVVEVYERLISKVVESNPSLRDVKDNNEQNALHCLASRVTKHKQTLSSVNRIVPMLRSDANVNTTDKSGQTPIHILQERAKKIDYEEFCWLTYQFRTSSNIETQNKKGQTALHILALNIPETGCEAFLELNGCLSSAKNLEMQDQNGQSVLHILAENIIHIGPVTFQQLAYCFMSSANIEIQDKTGQTVLHLLTKAVYSHPELGHDLQETLQAITTKSNVNATDKDLATPYLWIKAGKAQWADRSNLNTVFIEIEELFLDKGADVELTTQWKAPNTSDLMWIMANMVCTRQLTTEGQRILDLLEDEGEQSIHDDPEIFLVTVKKAFLLLSTPIYLEIIKKMAEMYEASANKPEEGPFEWLMTDPQFMAHLDKTRTPTELGADYQRNILCLIKILMSVDDSVYARTECLGALVMNANHIPGKGKLQWTDQLIDILKMLLDEGADPTCIPEELSLQSNKKLKQCTLFLLFRNLLVILANEARLVDAFTELLPLFLTEECLDHTEPKGRVLHALVRFDWTCLPEELPEDSLKLYQEVITEVVSENPALLDVNNDDGRNSLQYFISKITKHRHTLKLVSLIVPELKSEANVDATDKHGKTALHVLQERVLEIEYEAFCELTGLLRSPSNIEIQDKNCATALHILAKNTRENGYKAILELNGCLRSARNIDMLDKNGQTVLHILAGKVKQVGHEEFQQLAYCLMSSTNIEIQDKTKQTVLHLLTKAIYSHPELGHGLQDILQAIATKTNVNAIDKDLATPYLWIKAGKAQWENKDSGLGQVFSKIEDMFMMKGADVELRTRWQSPRYLELKERIRNFKKLKKLNDNIQEEFLQLLNTDGNLIVQEYPDVLQGTIRKASFMTESDHYISIIQKLVDIHKNTSTTRSMKPLELLAEQMENQAASICKEQTKLFALVEVLSEVNGHSHSRDKCLRTLIINSQPDHPLQWTEELISSLKHLLQAGADPTWLPGDLELNPSYHLCAQHVFVSILLQFLVENNSLCGSLMDIFPLFLSGMEQNAQNHQSTVLHSLATLHWKSVIEHVGQLPTNFYSHYKTIIAKVIESNPSLTDTLDWCGRTSLHLFIQQLQVHGNTLQNVCDVVLLLRSKTNCNAKDDNNRTPLHYLAEVLSASEQVASHHEQELLFNLVRQLSGPSNIDVQDKDGRTALHILVDGFDTSQHHFEQQAMFCELVNMLMTAMNIDVQDNQGHTILHILTEKYSQDILQDGQTQYIDIMQHLACRSKTDAQNGSGENILHIIGRKVYQNPYLGHGLLSLLPVITTSQTVNAPDKGSATPYSWILKGKLECEVNQRDSLEILCKFEEILLQNDADVDLARKGFSSIRTSDLLRTLENLNTTMDLTNGYKIIVNLFDGSGESAIHKDSGILLKMVRKANVLFSAPEYHDIIQRVTSLYKTAKVKPHDGSLDCLISQFQGLTEIHDDMPRDLDQLVQVNLQENLLQLIKILMTVDDSSQARTECLRTLAMNAKYTSTKGTLCWTDQFVNTLKLLIQEGADPTWIPDKKVSDICDSSQSAMYLVLQNFLIIIGRESHIVSSVIEIIQLFLTKNCFDHREPSGTMLHALVDFDWDHLPEHLPDDLYQQFEEAVQEVIAASLALLDISNDFGRMPIHTFVSRMKNHNTMIKKASGLIKILKSETNFDSVDKNGQSELHILQERISQINYENFHEFINFFHICCRTDTQDKNGQTALHILAKNASHITPEQFHSLSYYLHPRSYRYELDKNGQSILHILAENIVHIGGQFPKFMKSFSSSPNLPDKNGETVLHIVARNVFHHHAIGYKLMETFELLTTHENVNAVDHGSVTPYSWILAGKNQAQSIRSDQMNLSQNGESSIRNVSRANPATSGLRDPVYLELKEIVSNLTRPGDLDRHKEDRILNIVNDHGDWIVEKNKGILLVMVAKASNLIHSECYMDIIQVMVSTYNMISTKLQEGPLSCLVKQMDDPGEMAIFAKNQQKFFSLIELLLTADDSLYSRTKCLRFLVMSLVSPCKYLDYEIGLQYTEESIYILKMLLHQGADPTWIPENSSQSALRKVFEELLSILAFKNHLVSAFMELVQLLLTEKCLNHKEPRGTILHAMVGCNWEELVSYMPMDSFEQYIGVAHDIIEVNPQLLDTTDDHGRNPLHCLIDAIVDIVCVFGPATDTLNDDDANIEGVWTIHEVLTQLTSCLRSSSNINVQDKDGQTALHIIIAGSGNSFIEPSVLPEVCNSLKTTTNINAQDAMGRTPLHLLAENISDVGFDVFCQLVHILKSTGNSDIQDDNGENILHVLTRKMFLNPEVGRELLPILPFLVTSQNINALDENQVTPLTHILQGKLKFRRNVSDDQFQSIFGQIEDVFVQNGADVSRARNGLSLLQSAELENLLEKAFLQEHLVHQGQRIIELIADVGNQMLEGNPDMLANMVHKICTLIYSDDYHEIIQKLAQLYAELPNKADEGPLHRLVSQIDDRALHREALFEIQDKLLSLVQVLAPVDASSDSRSKCLGILIKGAKYISNNIGKLQWTEQFIDTLTLLLREGADPIWTGGSEVDYYLVSPPASFCGSVVEASDELESQSALYVFFRSILNVLANEKHIDCVIVELLPLFLTEKCVNHIEPSGTLLHALVDFQWECLPRHLPSDVPMQYGRIASEVVASNPALVDITVDNINPLQLFIGQITEHHDLLSVVNHIILVLKSDNSVDVIDDNGQTALHVLQEKVSEVSEDEFIQLTGFLKSASNIDIQDVKGQTPLHILAKNSSVVGPKLSLELNGCLKSSTNIDIQDTNGQTVLHILAERIISIGLDAFAQLAICLMSPVNIEAQDSNGNTVLHLLAKAVSSLQEIAPEVFSIFQLLATETNVNALDCNCATPYTWILNSTISNSETNNKTLLDIEQHFIGMGTDVDLAQFGLLNPVYAELNEVIRNLRIPDDLDSSKKERILQLLDTDAVVILQQGPDVFFSMVKKAFCLIKSDHYSPLIQEVATIYQAVANNTKKGPLEYLISQIRTYTEAFLKSETKLFKLVQTLVKAEECLLSRTKCLRALIMASTDGTKSKNCIEWTEDFISLLKFLLDKGADPTWLPEESLILERNYHHTAQHRFFRSLPEILKHKKELFNSLMDVLPSMIPTKSFNNYMKCTVLHTLVEEFFSRKDETQHSTDMLQGYKDIISKIKEHEPSLLKVTDSKGQTPLQFYLTTTRMGEDDLQTFGDVACHLISEASINIKDCQGQTVLHYLTEAFSKMDKVSQRGQTTFYDLVKSCTSSVNTDIQDKNGQTALHLLVKSIQYSNSR